jgi:hypothetical protein
MEVTEKQKQMLAATPYLNANQKQAVSLLQTLSEEEVAEVIEWTTPIIACIPSTNDVKRALQARGIATTDANIATVVTELNESMWSANQHVEQLTERAIDELVAKREQAAGQPLEDGKPQAPTYEDFLEWAKGTAGESK